MEVAQGHDEIASGGRGRIVKKERKRTKGKGKEIGLVHAVNLELEE
jgi:hypothetical protein